MSIRMKFIWGFLLCIVVSAGVVSGISVWKLNELSGTSFQQASGNQLQLTNRFITLFFQANISKLRFLSELKLVPQTAGHFPNFSQTTQETMYDVASLSPQARELFDLLQSMRQSSAELAEIFIGYADGSVQAMRNVSKTVPDPYVTWHPILPENVENPLAPKIKVEEKAETLPADLVVIAAGGRADDALFLEAQRRHAAESLYNIGDSFQVGKVFEAVRSAYALGLSL